MIIRRLFFRLFGKPAYTEHSIGRIWKEQYYCMSGKVWSGDIICLGGSTKLKPTDTAEVYVRFDK